MNAPTTCLHRRRSLARTGSHRKGVASVLAMLYMVLFATLAVGFAEATVMNAQISRNQRNLEQSRVSADAGLSFARYYLGSMTLPMGTTSANLLAKDRKST